MARTAPCPPSPARTVTRAWSKYLCASFASACGGGGAAPAVGPGSLTLTARHVTANGVCFLAKPGRGRRQEASEMAWWWWVAVRRG
uniref:Uncharacterized protein n=1 Tax=Arundo donax TaxID=35708 RepID=A0A0A9HWT5_ARUDO